MRKLFVTIFAAALSALAMAQDGSDIWEGVTDWKKHCPQEEMGDIVAYVTADIDGDGVLECFVRGADDSYALLTCGDANGKPDAGSIKLVVYSFSSTSLYRVEDHPYVLHQGGCGTGCSLNEYYKLSKSRLAATYRRVSYYGPDSGEEPSEETITFCRPGSKEKDIPLKAYEDAIPLRGEAGLTNMDEVFFMVGSDCECDGDCEGEYQNSERHEFDRLYSEYDADAAPNIRKFAEILDLYVEDENCDLKNGFFETGSEGDGAINWRGACWNRKDGSRLYIVSYWSNQNVMYNPDDERLFGTLSATSPWMAYNVCSTEDIKPVESIDGLKEITYFISCETGTVAFLYNAKTKKLEPIDSVSKIFNNLPEENNHRYLEVPRYGKDIKVREGMFNIEGKYKYHTLKWNGMTFDYVK